MARFRRSERDQRGVALGLHALPRHRSCKMLRLQATTQDAFGPEFHFRGFAYSAMRLSI